MAGCIQVEYNLSFYFSFIYDFLSVVLVLYKMNQCPVVTMDGCEYVGSAT